jgi:hypothetical protein
MKTILKSLSLATLLALVVFGCNKPPEYQEPSLSISVVGADTVSKEGGTVTIQIESNRPWTISASSAAGTTWYGGLPISSGENNRTITLDLEPNSGETRSVLISVVVTQTLQGSVTITQAGTTVSAGETIFFETFGTTGSTASPHTNLTAYAGFVTTGIGSENVKYVTISGTVTVRNNSSSNYPGASGGSNVIVSNGAGTFAVQNIASCGARNLTLSFGSNQTNDTLAVAYSPDNGTTWTELNYTKTTTTWGLASIDFVLPEGTTCFALRFAALNTSFGTRIDDIKVTTTDQTGEPANCGGGGIVDPPTDPDPAASLAEDFESFTSGPSNVFMSNQTDSRGWLGVRVQGTLEADVRESEGNKFVSFSAHRTSGVTVGATQEFWLISPRLNLDAATQKTLSFDMLGGFFNDNTEFKVYILDGADPATATKTELSSWRIPTADDPITNSYTSWISSGTIDLSAFSGVKRIGFYYKGTSGSGNSTTYRMDNFVFGGGTISTLTVSPTTLAFAPAGESNPFTINSNTTWTASSNADWCTIDQTSGDGNATITVTAAENPGAARQATITIQTTDGRVSRTVTVNQGNVPPENMLAEWIFTNATNLNATTGSGTISKTATGAISFTSASRTIWCGGWDGEPGKAWVLTIPLSRDVSGTVNVSFIGFGTATSPRDWILQASSDGTTWIDGDTYTLETTPNNVPTAANDVSVNVTLPTALTSGETLYLRLATRTSTSIGGGTTASGGNSRLADVVVGF